MGQVTIDVNGRPYIVGCEDGQEERLRDLARSVDAQVRHVARDVGPLGETRLILMGALIMADEMTELRAELDALQTQLADASSALGRTEMKAVALLEAAAEKIEAIAL